MRRALASRRTIAVCVLVAAAAATAVVLVTGGSDDPAARAKAASTSTATTRITRQDLVETDSEDGTLGYADSRSVINHLSGIVTWLPAVGAVVTADHALYKVDGKPVILMSGQVPVYRALKAGITDGRDIEQLEASLRDSGYDPSGAMTVNESWGASTTAAVKRWQTAHGMTADGSIELGQVVFLPGARRIASMAVTLGGSTSGSGGGGGGAENASASAAEIAASAGNGGQTAYVSAREMAQATTPTTPTTPPTATTPATTTSPPTTTTPPAATTPARPQAPATQSTTPATPSTPAARSGGGGDSGDSGGNGGSGGSTVSNAIMTTTSTRRVVTVQLDTAKSSLAKKGSRVGIDLPSGDSVHGRISSVGKVATSSSSDSGAGGGGGGDNGDSGTATIKVTIRLSQVHTSLDQAPVTVNFESERRRDVLAIPVTALLAQPGGRFAVEVVQAGGAKRLVRVQTGIYTSGFVEIEGSGLQPGMRVTNAAV